MINLDVQVFILFYSFISGIICGVGFDIYRILFRSMNNKILGFIRDSSYFIIIGLIVFWFLLYTQYAILSVYTYFYVFLGLVFYLKVISKFVFPKVQKIIEFIGFIFRYMFRTIIYFLSRGIGKKNS